MSQMYLTLASSTWRKMRIKILFHRALRKMRKRKSQSSWSAQLNDTINHVPRNQLSMIFCAEHETDHFYGFTSILKCVVWIYVEKLFSGFPFLFQFTRTDEYSFFTIIEWTNHFEKLVLPLLTLEWPRTEPKWLKIVSTISIYTMGGRSFVQQ